MWVRRLIERMLEAEGRLVAAPQRGRLSGLATSTEVWQTRDGRRVGGAHAAHPSNRARARPCRPLSRPAPTSTCACASAATVDRRSYSIVDAERDGRRLAVSVFEAGGVARRRGRHARARPGDQLEITQPMLDFPLRVGAPRYVLLAGGIGITALSAMAAGAALHRRRLRARLRGRSRESMAYLDALLELHGDRLAAARRAATARSLSVPDAGRLASTAAPSCTCADRSD